jgi:hypothetical protein
MVEALFQFRQPERRQIGAIPFDVLLEETYEHTGRLTKNPTETGASIADHFFLEPVILSITGEVTNSPIQFFPSEFVGIQERAIEAWQQLRALHELGQPLDLLMGFDLYRNMVLTELTTQRTPATGQRLVFRAVLEEIRFARTFTVPLSTDNVSAEFSDFASSTLDLGRQSTRPASSALAARAGAIL